MNFIDTHSHLNFAGFRDGYLAVFDRAKKAGLKKIIIPGSDFATSLRAVEIAREINAKFSGDFAFATVGIHPVHADRAREFAKIIELAKEKEVVAIGETGLDNFYSKDHLPEQTELLKRHIALALELNKPVIFHNREADAEILEILNTFEKLPRGVFHCFSSDHAFAAQILERGFLISFTGNITYGNKKLKKVIERTAITKMMIETDSPYLVPEPLRSNGVKPNEPQYVLEVAQKIAAIKNLDLAEVLSATTQTAEEFFGFYSS